MDSPGGQANTSQVDLLSEIIRFALNAENSELPQRGDALAESLASLNDGFIDAVRVHQVEHLVDDRALAPLLPDSVVGAVHDIAIDSAAAALACAKDAVEAIRALHESGIPALVFKGVALSQVTTGTLTSRGQGDIDILVEDGHVLHAAAILQDLGWELEIFTPTSLHKRWRFVRWSSREVTLQGARTQIDLHWQVAKEHRVTPSAAQLLAAALPIDIAGTELLTLSRADALLCACYHLDHDGYRSLRQVVDVIRLVRIQTSAPHWTRREHHYADLAISFARRLLGGITSRQMRTVAIAEVDSRRADLQWQANRNYPTQGYRPAARNLLDKARTAMPARGFAPWELARLSVSRLTVRNADR